jgi:4-amino-4-deoxy-L-arabinose transferase-like glycosyltransferase
MRRVSLLFELLRAQPRGVVWLIALAQAALWWLVSSVFYAAPPGNLPLVLAVGHEFQLGSYYGPPLAFWLAEIAYDIAGMPGVYLLAQVCVVITYWAVFELGRATLGVAHGAIAVMLMVGVFAFGLPTLEFGPPILAMALSALVLLHFWRAAAQAKRLYWSAFAVDAGLLLLTSYAGVVLLAVLLVFILATRRGRALLGTIDPWLAGIVIVFLTFPHLIWLDGQKQIFAPVLDQLKDARANIEILDWLRMPARILLLHTGLVALALLASGWPVKTSDPVPQFARAPVHPFAKGFIYTFAIAPLVITAILGIVMGDAEPAGGTAPVVIITALAVVLAAGDVIELNRQYALARLWGAVLIAPPVITVLVLMFAPALTGARFAVSEPAKAMGRYFSGEFLRRTGQPLAIAAGEERIAALVALRSRPRASLYLDATPERSPWVTTDDVRRKGAVVVWSAGGDTTGTPPPEVGAHFPELVPDIPRVFDRFTVGGVPRLRIGWGVQRSGASNQ